MQAPKYTDPNPNIDWDELSRNPSAIDLLEQYPEKICWTRIASIPNLRAIHLLEKYLNQTPLPTLYLHNPKWYVLSSNPCAMYLLEKYPEKIHWDSLSGNTNTNAITLLEQNMDKINWHVFSKNSNPRAVQLLKQYPDKISWNMLCQNVNPEAIQLLEKKPHYICWSMLCENPSAVYLLEKNPNKILWYCLCDNQNAIHLIEKNIDYILKDKYCMAMLSRNPNAIHLLEKYSPKNIHWPYLSRNPNAMHLMAKYDYPRMKHILMEFCRELVTYVFNPVRISALCELYNIEFSDYLDSLDP